MSFFKRSVYSELNPEALSLHFILTDQFCNPLRKDIIETAFEAFALGALPLDIILAAQENKVFRGYIGGAAGRFEHLTLHDVLDLARKLNKKFLPFTPHRLGFFFDYLRFIAIQPFLEFGKEVGEVS